MSAWKQQNLIKTHGKPCSNGTVDVDQTPPLGPW